MFFKKNRKTKWYWKGATETPVATKKHRVFDENGNEIEDEDYWGYRGTGPETTDTVLKTKHHSQIDWDSYNKSGSWKGYEQYKPSTLSYSYVNQMANMIASQHMVNTKIGNDWSIDLDTKTLEYNPISLMKMTKGEVLATLLHEVGKISLCVSMKNIRNPFFNKYGENAYKVQSAFDDFRVDDKMISSYPSAAEVYESQNGILTDVVKEYMQLGVSYEKYVKKIIEHQCRRVDEEMAGSSGNKMSEEQLFQSSYFSVTNDTSPFTSFKDYSNWVKDFLKKPFDSTWDYLAIVLDKGYGINSAKHKDTIEKYFELTSPAIATSVKFNSSQELADDMNTSVFPHIEELLKTMKDGNSDMQKGLGEKNARHIAESAGYSIQEVRIKNDQGKTVQPARGQKAGDNSLPREWAEGDYKSLRDSVSFEIKSLYNKMVNLRRMEQTVKFENHQRRGKLNSKVLYRHALGSNRLFKKKEETTDTIRSFTFSMMVDVSGSMHGSRIIHTTRALILLSEVFTKLGMEFEIIHFDTEAHVTKSFEEPFDKATKARLAGYISANGGGTRLACALKKTKLPTRREMNRVAIVLTDGDTEPHDGLNHTFFTPWDKKGVKSIVLGLETHISSIQGLNNGKGIAVTNAAQVPKLFYDLLKGLIFKR